MKFFEAFTGIGGFSLGLPKKWQCVGFSEIDKYCDGVLKYNFPYINNYGDITKIQWPDIENFDMLCGGFPCTFISSAGKATGIMHDKLFLEIIRCLEVKQPKYLMLENVPNLLKINKGDDFDVVLKALANCGYNVWWQVIDTKDFGTELSRPRLIIVGNRGQDQWKEKIPIGRKIKISDQTLPKETSQTSIQMCRTDFKGISKQRLRLLLIDSTGLPRIPTVLERERLVGFPDDWTKYMYNRGQVYEVSNTQRIAMTGNAVAPYVISFVKQHYFGDL